MVPLEWVLVVWYALATPPAAIERFHSEASCVAFKTDWEMRSPGMKNPIHTGATCVPKQLPEVKLGVPCPGGLRRPDGQYYCPGAKKGR